MINNNTVSSGLILAEEVIFLWCIIGKLKKVNDRKTDDFLTKIVIEAEKKRKGCGHKGVDRNCKAWLGGKDKRREGRWVWIDGGIQTYPIRYTNWDSNEPNNHNGNEDCLVTNWDGYGVGHGRWNDVPCNHTYGFICRREPCRSGSLCRHSGAVPKPLS